MRLILISALAGLLTAGCASTYSGYQPSTERGGYGYAEAPIDANRVRVSFNGNTSTDRNTVEMYLLYRAAEVTLQRGYDYFVVIGHDVDEQITFEPIGGRPRISAGYRQETSHQAFADIAMFRGSRPARAVNAFGAREVIASLDARIERPQAR